jgi:DNA-binding transcriptional LysR family regulator
MELRQLRSFCSIAQTLSFGRSAELIHLSQPAISLQIKALEEELGVKLFERNRRTTSLTPAGLVFQRSTDAILRALDEATRDVRQTESGHRGLLRIGFISTAGHEIVPELIRKFRDLYPEVQFSLRNILTTDQIDLLGNDTIDVGFLRLPIGEQPKLKVIPIHREGFVVALPALHRLARRKNISLNDLRDDHFVMYERRHAPGFHDLLLGAMNEAGIVPRIVQTAGEMPTLVSLVDSGIGVAILPASALRHKPDSVIACTLTDAMPSSDIGVVIRRQDRSSLLNNFMDLIERTFFIKGLAATSRRGLNNHELH